MSYVLLLVFVTYGPLYHGASVQKFKTKAACEQVLKAALDVSSLDRKSKCIEVKDE